MFNKKHSEESKKRISLSKLGKPVNYITGHADFNGNKNPFWGKSHSDETKAKISLANKGHKRNFGRVASEETKRLISIKAKRRFKNGTQVPFFLGKTLPAKTRQLMSQKTKARFEDKRNHPSFGRKLSPEHKAVFSRLGWRHNNKTKELLRRKARQLWEDKDYIKNVLHGLNIQPNKLEKRIISVFKKHNLPYLFNGASADIIIGRHIPDFVNINGKKEVIEIFGNYWHDPKINPKIESRRTQESTLKHYKKYGYNCIIIWEDEILRFNAEELILAKLGSIQTGLKLEAKA